MLDPTIPLVPESDLVREWQPIADELGVVVRTAQRLAERNKDPLPVYEDHRGIVVHRVALREWIIRQRVPHVVALSRKKSRRRRKRPKQQHN